MLLILFIICYIDVAYERYKMKTKEQTYHEATLNMIAFQIELMLFQACFLLYIWLVVLKTRPDSRQRVWHLKFNVFFVTPVMYLYLYYQLIELTSDMFDKDKLPEAKPENENVTWNYYIMAVCTIFFFLIFTSLLVIILIYVAVILKTKFDERQAANQTYNVT